MWFICKSQNLSFLLCHGFLLFSQDACPKNASYYGNRAATLMMLSRFREALEDSQQAVRLDDCFMKVGYMPVEYHHHHPFPALHIMYHSFPCRKEVNMSDFYTLLNRKCTPHVPQGHMREGKCHLSLGNAKAASRCFQKVLELEPSNQEAKQEVEITFYILFLHYTWPL